MKNLKSKKGGISILGILFLTILLILVLSFFHINLRTVVQSPDAQNNFQYVGYAGRSLWNDYLAKPISNILNDAIVKNLWNSFVSNMQKIHNGQPTDFQKFAPTIN